ncbi:hypothetical protein MPSI1_000046 [Malassezia psittaci]|uniref:C2H2-type domain-containing protein n=1 Tax=Malassezia psittaci TaxID=1821823 RepID=A0AAF0F7G5_9BASI|nr:hypothetical protein MPSI1_000046 [Malassezia psittaci]
MVELQRGRTYGNASTMNFRSNKPVGNPAMTEAGRIVLNGHSPVPSMHGASTSLRVPHASTRARSPSYSNNLSTSFGAAGEALSHSANDPPRWSASDSAPGNRPGSMGSSEPREQRASSAQYSSTVPTHSFSSVDGVAHQYGLASEANREGSVARSMGDIAMDSSMNLNESEQDYKDANCAHPSNQLLHKCESCSKVYRHPSCLVKHRWVGHYAYIQEHTMYWKEASKFLMSKHQQVQLLEAAAILVGMDSNARSLPEEKALWPAAVSPPSSGLLGCDQVNFDKLMASKTRSSPVPSVESVSMPFGTSAPVPSHVPSMIAHRGMHMRKHSGTRLPRMDDDAEDDGMGANDDSSELELPPREDGYGLHSGGDVMADMDMDADD